MATIVEFSLSRKGKRLAFSGGFVYHHKQELKDGSDPRAESQDVQPVSKQRITIY